MKILSQNTFEKDQHRFLVINLDNIQLMKMPKMTNIQYKKLEFIKNIYSVRFLILRGILLFVDHE